MKSHFLLVLLLFAGLLPAQKKTAPKVKYETDVTGARKKFETLEDHYHLGTSPNTIKGAIYADVNQPAAERAKDLIRRLTFEEKLALTGGYFGFQTTPVERLGIRPAFMADASQGVRLQTSSLLNAKSTSFPGMMPLASTWNPELSREFGKAIGEECLALGVDILLGPSINFQRLSVGGRNFEYMGEDPYLTTAISFPYIDAMEKTGILSCPKVILVNDIEFCRHIENVIVSERALREIYLQPWEKAIKDADCSTIMTSNNLINGVPAAMHKGITGDILRKEYGFKGMAMTDWQNSNYFPTMQDLILPSGETLMMPQNEKFAAWVKAEIAKSPIRKAEIEILLENMIYPNLYVLFKKGAYDRAPQNTAYHKTFEAHKTLAGKTAEEAIVLLKNDKNILPVAKDKRIVMFGEPEIHSGKGSGFVVGYDHVTFADGLKATYGDNFTWIQKMDEKLIKSADVVLFNFSKTSGEGRDIPFEEGIKEIEALKQVAKLNRNVVVLMNSCNVMPMDWLKDIKGLLWCYFLGQERGNALANIISGKVSPSGKLPFTIEKSFADSPDPDFNYIGGRPYWFGNNQYKKYWLGEVAEYDTAFTNHVKPFQTLPVYYDEETLVGYRWYDYHKIPVHFDFGFGLSYSKFALSNFRLQNNYADNGTMTVEVTVKNTGKYEAKEVVQVYVSDKVSTVVRAPKELKAFQKVSLQPGEQKTVKLVLDQRAFAFWDEANHNWKVESGEFVIAAGNSSENLPFSEMIVL